MILIIQLYLNPVLAISLFFHSKIFFVLIVVSIVLILFVADYRSFSPFLTTVVIVILSSYKIYSCSFFLTRSESKGSVPQLEYEIEYKIISSPENLIV